MKKFLLILSAVTLLLAGCAKEETGSETGSGEMVKASFTAVMQGTPQTKAVTDGDGAAANVNRCIMEIYYNDVLYLREVKEVSNASKQATFNPNLVSNRKYDVVFWADCGEGLADKYYKTNAEKDGKKLGLQAVEMITDECKYTANDDARDAFFVKKQVEVLQQVSSEEFMLKRPFAQVNIITTDAAVIKDASLYPDGVKMVYTAPTKFNLLTGELSEDKELTVTGTPYEAFDATSTALTLEMDYLFAGLENSVLNIEFEASKTGESAKTKRSFTNIPVQRNYRTNIKGALLTTTGNWTVEIDPDWLGNGTSEEDPWLVNYVETGSIAAANDALKTNNAVSIENPSDLGTAIVIPAEQNGNNVFITVTGASAGDITVKQENVGPASLDIESDSKNLSLELPSSHVNVNKGVNYEAITAETGDNTLVIGKDVKVKKLTTTKGAVVVNGQVEELSCKGVAQVNISTAEGLMTYATALNAKKYTAHYANLVADIDMTGKAWVPMSASESSLRGFDGENHVISNLTVTQSASGHSGLFGSLSGDIQNVTVKNAVVTYPESVADQARVGVICSYFHGGTIINCHVDGATIKASQKVGGIVGNLEAYSNTVISNCSAKDITMGTNCNDLVYQAAGIVGYVQQASPVDITVKNCSVENIVVNNAYSGSDNKAWHCHSLIGNISNTAAGHTIALENNTVDAQLPVERTVYTTDYFGWAGNEEAEAGKYKAVITIDGQEWAPNYPVKIVGGKGYATLAEALTAATEGQTVQILKAGDYTVQKLDTKAAVVEATVEGVVFNRTSGGHVTSYGTTTPVTVKNLTWNLGSSNYQYFNCKVENCTINGRPSIHTFASFKDCELINTYASDYCITTYGSPCTFENCKFSSQGKFVNVYGENQTSSKEVTATNCKFVNLKSSVYKAAFNIKGNADGQIQHTHVIVNNCTTEGLFPDHTTTDGSAIFFDGGLIMFDDPAWEDDVYAVVDGVTYYPYFTIDANGNYSVKNANGLKAAVKHWNALTSKGEKTITMADGTYEVSDIPIIQAKEKSLVVKAANAKNAVLTPDTGTKTNMIFLISGGGLSTTGDEWVTFEGLKFNMPNDPGKITSAVFCTAQNDATYSPLVGESMTRYAHNITVRNCELQGCGSENSSLLKAAQGAGANIALVDNCVVNHSGYVVSDYFSNVRIANTKVTDTKACANIANVGITVEGCNISTYHDYCIRTNGGAVVVQDNTFTMTYDGAATDAGIVVLRGTGDQASISGNTITKAVNTMWDCYCKTAWTVNGEAKAAGTGINF